MIRYQLFLICSVLTIALPVNIIAQSPLGYPYLGLQYNPYTSPLFGYGLGPQYGTLYGSLASNYLYGNSGPYGGVPAYAGYPGGYGVYGGFGALGYGTHGVVDNYKQYYGYGYEPYDYKARSSPDTPTQDTSRAASQ
ncbi:shematrin-like protein 3 [Tetranychus urticae]|uniref:shematrin-like protein 3 n=1 Tax=Tetranychus urticae TaxID=32264 RepID=UPI00077BE8BF|nr:shematrin-like protein 3 [Tetranychus urticae]